MLTHRDLCKIAANWLLAQSWCKLVAWEITYNRGFADAIGVSKCIRNNTKIAVCEVKRTRADLLADLRKLKLLKYERGSTHCYLAITRECLGNNSPKEFLADLGERGLPRHWGILLLPSTIGRLPTCVRRARRLRPANATRLRLLTEKIAVQHMYRNIKNGAY